MLRLSPMDSKWEVSLYYYYIIIIQNIKYNNMDYNKIRRNWSSILSSFWDGTYKEIDVIKNKFRWIFCVFLVRLFKRIISINLIKLYTWEYESCFKCGSLYRIVYYLKDDIFMKITGNDNHCYCLECILNIAEKKNIQITIDDFVRLWLFNPELKLKSVDIIEREK